MRNITLHGFSQPVFSGRSGKTLPWTLGLVGLASAAIGLAATQDRYTCSKNQPGLQSQPAIQQDLFGKFKPGQLKEWRRQSVGGDLRAHETHWAEQVSPVVIPLLEDVYKADNAGKTKICIAEFVPPGQFGADGGRGPSLHFLRMKDTELKDGTQARVYLNEYWPVHMQTGGLSLPDLIRVRIVFLRKGQTEPEIITDQLQVLWADHDGYSPKQAIPIFYRQHYFDTEKDAETGRLKRLQVEHPASAPMSCIRCHNPQLLYDRTSANYQVKPKPDPEIDAIMQKAFPDNWREAEVMTPEKAFYPNTPIKQHSGYRAYAEFLQTRVQNNGDPNKAYEEKTDAQTAKQLLEDLRHPKRLRVPGMVTALSLLQKDPKRMVWVEGDRPYTVQSLPRPLASYWQEVKVTGEDGKEKKENVLFEKAGYYDIYQYYQQGLGYWWIPQEDLQALPLYRSGNGTVYPRYDNP